MRDEIFIRLLGKSEHGNPTRSLSSIPDLEGYEKVYKPYGEDGRGFYYVKKMKGNPSMKTFHYFIDLDERGEFHADVRNKNGDTVFEIDGFDFFEDGWMKHKKDLDGLEWYLKDLGIMKKGDRLVYMD
jgi:hypothetical protein